MTIKNIFQLLLTMPQLVQEETTNIYDFYLYQLETCVLQKPST